VGVAGKPLSKIKLFSGLSDEELDDIERRCRWHSFPAQEQIIDRQSDDRDIYFIVQGAVRVLNYSFSGREIAFDDIQAGSIFGELAALDGEPRSANVVTVAPTEAATMTPSAFQDVMKEYPSVAVRLMQRMAQVIRVSTDRIMDLSTLGANNRVYAEILRLAHENEAEEDSAVISPVPIHGDIASRVSTTRETVARVLSDLSKKGLVIREGNKLIVNDLLQLREMVEEFRGE
jgi:CRP-like cAMP-binding protein